MANGFVHTVYKNNQWINEVEGDGEIGGVHAAKEEQSALAAPECNRTRPITSSTTRTARSADATPTATIP